MVCRKSLGYLVVVPCHLVFGFVWFVALVFTTARAQAAPIVNGDFETGDFTAWTIFNTSTGVAGGGPGGFPKVASFDTDGDSTASLSAEFRVGQTVLGTGSQGGGIFQDVSLLDGDLLITADIAATSTDGNSDAGLFELLFDGVVRDGVDFGGITAGAILRDTLFASIPGIAAGSHEIRFRFTRPAFPASGTPIQIIDDIQLSGSAVPEPGTVGLLAVGAALLCIFLIHRSAMKTEGSLGTGLNKGSR